MGTDPLRDGTANEREELGQLFAGLSVPALPQVTTRLLAMLRNEELAPATLAEVISCDPGICTKILRLVNSASLGLTQEIGDVRLAVSLLGVSRIQSLVLGISVVDSLPQGGPMLDQEDFWRASLQRAAFAETLAGRIDHDHAGEAFTGALLQDMAQPVLLTQWEQEYAPVFRAARDSRRELVQIEAEKLSWTHAHAAAWMARHWGLPESLASALELHHAEPGELETLGLAKSWVAAVAASARVPEALPFCSAIGLSDDAYWDICEVTDRACSALASLFGLRTPKRLTLAF